ncbi:unnamed protein product [Ostreobium quekettii]|uniref:Ankyrin repeat protein n=1 Tax=Ostreobium quekettii TaxID=121088 RepID=A0A8S1ILD0_9CHLO|nr:unnamed protein product [Ostreobium quekettii]|eukprot:evm.model.scf_24.10 EVM.evm.TU.scf_24.10   scf_24:214587-216192(+)
MCLFLCSALHFAAANGHTDVVARLLQAGATVNPRNEHGNTPLHWASLNGHREVVSLLMGAGADPAAVNRADRTPVDEASQAGHMEVVEILTLGRNGQADIENMESALNGGADARSGALSADEVETPGV